MPPVVPWALRASDHLPLSQPAQVVKGILHELAGKLKLDGGLHSVS